MKSTKILSFEDATSVGNSSIKMDILETLQYETIKSMRHLARRIGKDSSDVREHIYELEDMGLISLEDDTSFGAYCKKPRLNFKNIISEPILTER